MQFRGSELELRHTRLRQHWALAPEETRCVSFDICETASRIAIPSEAALGPTRAPSSLFEFRFSIFCSRPLWRTLTIRLGLSSRARPLSGRRGTPLRFSSFDFPFSIFDFVASAFSHFDSAGGGVECVRRAHLDCSRFERSTAFFGAAAYARAGRQTSPIALRHEYSDFGAANGIVGRGAHDDCIR